MPENTIQQGIITILFEKDHRSVRPAVMSLKQEYQEVISTSFHAPMRGDVGIEIILVCGEGPRITSLEKQLLTKRGIRSARLMLIPA